MHKHTLMPLLLVAAALTASAQKPDPQEQAIRKLLQSTIMINQLYVDTINLESQVEDAIRGMLSKLDPHSSYTNAEETRRLNEPLQGNFEGIGVSFSMLDDTLVVNNPTPKGPSERAGILPGDRIVAVNDTAIAGVKMPRDAIMKRLRGPKDTKVRLKVVRPGVQKLLSFTIKRDKIPMESLDAAYMAAPGVGLIRFSSFAATTHAEVMKAFDRLRKEGMRSLIIDLQGNGGGYLGAAVELAGEFLRDGDRVVYTEGRDGVLVGNFFAQGLGAFTEGTLVVLIDEQSASASEILAGALQDQDRATIIGRRSFGKGLVQKPLPLDDGSMIRLTTQRYFTPSGRCIQKPYEKGNAREYSQDVIDRYNRGELTNADSIHFPDSLRRYTLREHRTVYGGGGIMPDIFVPLDTTRYTRDYRYCSARNYISEAHLRYINAHRKELARQWQSADAFLAGYTTPEELVQQVIDRAVQQDSLKVDSTMLERTRINIGTVLKALVARDLWELSQYFQVIYADDPMVLRAIQFIADDERRKH